MQGTASEARSIAYKITEQSTLSSSSLKFELTTYSSSVGPASVKKSSVPLQIFIDLASYKIDGLPVILSLISGTLPTSLQHYLYPNPARSSLNQLERGYSRQLSSSPCLWPCFDKQQMQLQLTPIDISYMQNTARKGWQQIEDLKLIKVIRKHGFKNWSLIAEKLADGTNFERTGKQCRQRWYNHLNPQIDNKPWSPHDDQVLFEAHHRLGCRWKQISLLLSGRTDCSVKNHFYSTVRRCLRKVCKQNGERDTTITMKSIKPNVLSRIVENTELTGLIVKLGKGRKKREGEDLDIDEGTVQRIRRELRLINVQQGQTLGDDCSFPKRQEEHRYTRPDAENHLQIDDILKQKINGKETIKINRTEQPITAYNPQKITRNRSKKQEYGPQALDQPKERYRPQSYGLLFPLCSKEYLDRLMKDESNHERQDGIEYCGMEEADSNNFFLSPSCTHIFPDMRLLAKLSKVSLELSPIHSHTEDRNRPPYKSNATQNERPEYRFEANAYLDESNNSQPDNREPF